MNKTDTTKTPGGILVPAGYQFMEYAPPQPESREIATTLDGRDITRGYISPDQLALSGDSVLQLRGAGSYDIYQDIRSDAQVHATLQQRQLAMVAAEWEVLPGGPRRVDRKAADQLAEQLTGVNWDKVSGLMHWGVFYGVGVAELLWSRDGAQVGIADIKVRDRNRFRFDAAGRCRLLTTASPAGELLPPAKFWQFSTGADHADEPYGLGLAHWCYWPVQFKKQGIRFWLIHLDKFGSPTAKGVFPPNATPEEQKKLLYTLRAIQTDAGIIVPEGTDISLLERAAGGRAEHHELVRYMDSLIAKVNLGQTLTSESEGGQYKAEVQMEVRQALTKADADLLCDSFSRGPGAWLAQWNYPSAKPPRVRRLTEDAEDLNARAEREHRLWQMGFVPTLETVNETYPGEFERLAVAQPAPSAVRPAGVEGAGTDATIALAEAAEAVGEGELEALAEQLDGDALQALLEPMLAPLLQLVRQDPAGALGRLAEVAPNMDIDALQESVARMLFVAELWGQVNEDGSPASSDAL